ncbi:NB-ARC domain-containing protein [Leptothoe sp. PORK10 BA2]|uniref:WD40 domain-containing protein n=1 Tax=Leptothoe sp. PORK10 BA2 TaxID=3110254 RepID=UPI002B1F2F90|nr:NB-ARC domain-containing protein [Leptothoe sp. PORK10 BA2]MEA5464773.1 NB-ARC domain-containing protein [Leptothoe sp. PORK10 BA2]
MSRSPKRYRGVVLTQQGIERLEAEIATAQNDEKYGKRFTQAELSERANLSIKTIKKIRDRTAHVDEVSVRTLFEAFELSLESADYGLPELPPSSSESELASQGTCITPKIDWGEKPDTAIFFGRTEDLVTLDQWVMTEQCRLVTLLGMGGIGKTSLAAKLADQIYEQFDYVIWRSLREAPPLDEILVRLIQFLSDQQETEINLPTRLGERIIRLLHYLREHRCLLVLDNLESILQAESAGQFRNGYESYGELIHRIGEAEHQSCLLLTSRECPRELALMAGAHLPVRLWSVEGIDSEAGQEILKAKGLNLEDADNQGQELIRLYSGNPQALHLVATAIRREYLGDVDDFLEEEGAALEDVRSLLDQHLTRLAPLERSILFWLAINREPIGIEELMEDLLPPVAKRDVRSALTGLCDRYLIETVGKQFTLQNVIMEFVTNRFVEQVSREINSQEFDLLHTHALLKAMAKDYVRETQIRLILNPVVIGVDNLETQINCDLIAVKQSPCWYHGYAAGNLLNMLCQNQFEVAELDFSQLTLRQTYLKETRLQSLNLTNTQFVKPALIYPFDVVNSVAFSPDGQWLASGSRDGTLRLWNIEQRLCIHSFEGHTHSVSSVTFSPDGQWLASGSRDGTLRLWNIEQRLCVYSFEGHAHSVRSVTFSPDGQWLASGGGDNNLRLWDIQQRQCIHVFTGHTDWIHSVCFSPDGQRLASGSSDATIRLWDVKQQHCIHVFTGHTDWVWSISFSPDGQWLASGSRDNTIRLWDAKHNQYSRTISGHTGQVNAVSFSPNGQQLATGGGDATVRLWDVQQGQCIHIFTGFDDWVGTVIFSPDGQWLASGSRDATIRLWDIERHNCVHTFTGHTDWVWSVAFNPNGQWLASGSRDAIIRLWDMQQKRCAYNLVGHTDWVREIVFSPNGQWLASASDDATVRLWDIEQQYCTHVFTGHTDQVWSVAFSPDGQWLASGSRDATIRLWDIQQQQCIHIFTGHTDRVTSIAFSPDGQWLASGSDDKDIRLWDTKQQQCVHTFNNDIAKIGAVTFSPDGKWLAIGTIDTNIQLLNVEQRQCVHTFTDHTAWIRALVFSPDGQWLASGSGDTTIRLWDVEQHQCVHKFTGHTAWVRALAFSSDGQWLASGSSDATIQLWDIETKERLAVLPLPGPYEGSNIHGARGLTEAQRDLMLALGAVE